MNSTKYIISKIDELVRLFPAMKLSYQVDDWSETHFIEVLPKDLFECYEDKFVAAQNKVVLDFIQNYPDEGLAFITKDDLFSVNNPVYIKVGVNYEQALASLMWHSSPVEQLLNDFEPQIDSHLTLTQKIEEINQNPVRCDIKFRVGKSSPHFEPLTNNLSKKSTKADYEIAGDDEPCDANTYSLAA